MTIYIVIAGYGFTLAIWTKDQLTIAQTIFAFYLIRKYMVWRGEKWSWLNEYGHASLFFERHRDGKVVDGWGLSGPLIRTVAR